MKLMNILPLLLAVSVSCFCDKPVETPDPDPIDSVTGETPASEPQEPEELQTPADPRDLPAGDGILRILAIGNSFSADAVEQELWPLFNAVGQKAIIAQLYIAGCDLETHCKTIEGGLADYSYRKIVDGVQTVHAGSKFLDGLLDEKWDYISVQQGGGHHGQFETFEPWMTKLIDYCRENAPYRKFKLVYHVPWAAPAHSTNAKFGFYDYDQQKMYSMITETTRKVEAAYKFDLIINSVDAIQNGRSSYLGDTFDRDGWHLNKTYGRYTAGCIWYEKISGKSVLDNPYHPSSISDQLAELCKTAAHEACLHPYQVTDLSSRFIDPNPPSQQGTVLAQWEFSALNAVEDAYISTFTGLADNNSSLGKYVYSNKAGEVGYIASNKQAGGRLSYVQVDKTAWSDKSGNERAGVQINAVGQPEVAAAQPGDYWLFELPSVPLKAGTSLQTKFCWNSNKYGSKYWLLEYMDGNEWKPVPDLELRTSTVSGSTYDSKIPFSETITYNIAFAASEKRTISTTVTLLSDTPSFKLRMTCCMEYQVNGRHFLHPRTQSVQNIDSSVQPSIVRLD